MDDVQARHGAYFARLGEQAARRLNGPDQAVWATRLDQEQANLRAAWLWSAADPARAVTGLTMVSGLWEYWLIRGLLDQGAAWLEDALQRAAGPAGVRADALAGLAVITCLRGDVQQGGELFAASITLHEQARNWAGHSRALALLGFWRANQGDQAGSADALDRAMMSAGMSRDPYFAAFTLLMAGMAALLTGRIPLARARASESGRLFADIGGRRGPATPGALSPTAASTRGRRPSAWCSCGNASATSRPCWTGGACWPARARPRWPTPRWATGARRRSRWAWPTA
jgi:hypothetical protein